MADRDEEQILYDTIAEGSSQYWNEEEGNVERDAEGNQQGHVERDVEGNQEEEASGSQPSVGQKRARGQRGAAKKLEGRHIITEVEEDGRPSARQKPPRTMYVTAVGLCGITCLSVRCTGEEQGHAEIMRALCQIRRKRCCGPQCSRHSPFPRVQRPNLTMSASEMKMGSKQNRRQGLLRKQSKNRLESGSATTGSAKSESGWVR